MRDDGQVVVLVGVSAAEPLRPFHVLDLGDDADLGQLRGDHFTALACVGHGWQFQAQLKRCLDAGFCQQRLGLLDIERVDTRGVHIAKSTRYVMAANGHAVAVGCAFNDGLAVNRGSDGAAHAHIVKRLLLVVDRQNGLGTRAADHHLELGVGLELHHAARRDAWEGIDVTGQQGSHLRCRVADEAESHLLDLDASRIAVAVPLAQCDRRTFVPCRQLVRAGANRLGCIVLDALGLDDDGRGLTHQEQEVRVQSGVQDNHGVVVNCCHARHAGEGAFVLVGALLGSGTLKRKFDGLGVEGFAVLELDALAQFEGVGLEVGRDFPAFCQQG